MNCSIVNARPHNISIDANATDDDNRAFSFTFYGDRTIGADFFIYNMNTNNLWNGKIYSDYAASNSKKYYYNGEEIDVHVSKVSSNNNKQFIWKTRVYEDVDISNGKNPTNRLVTGTIKPNPYLSGNIVEIPEEYKELSEKYIYIELNSEYSITLPSWIYISDDRRVILEYNRISDNVVQIKLKNSFTLYPIAGTAYTISPYRTSSIEEVEASQLFIATDINIVGDAKDHRNYGTGVDIDYPTNPQPCYYLGLGDDVYGITNYNPQSGLVTLDKTPASNVSEVGLPYTIYSSFVESPYFYFTTEPTPKIKTITMIQDGEVVKCNAVLNSKSFVKYQYWEIYDVTNPNNIILVETSEKMYLDDLEFVFRGGIVDSKYKAILHVVTQTNWDISKESEIITIVAGNDSTNIKSFSFIKNDENNCIQLNITLQNGISKNGGIKILRQEIKSSYIEYLDTINFNTAISSGSVVTFNDYKSTSNTDYKYYIICFNPTIDSNKITLFQNYVTSNISTLYNSYSIYALQEVAYERFDIDTDKRIDYDYMYAERKFKILDIFKPELNVTEKHKINHNLGRDIYVGYSKKPVVSAKNTAYDTFSLSFQLGNTSIFASEGATLEDALKYNWGYTKIINNDVEYFCRLKHMIEEAPPFLIKDYKGNAWFGSINTFNTEIDNSVVSDKIITINIDFVETYPIEKVKVVG